VGVLARYLPLVRVLESAAGSRLSLRAVALGVDGVGPFPWLVRRWYGLATSPWRIVGVPARRELGVRLSAGLPVSASVTVAVAVFLAITAWSISGAAADGRVEGSAFARA
jgi:hypothetical protein